jgi:hypothetical protein
MEEAKPKQDNWIDYLRLGLLVGIAANALVIYYALPFFSVPRGAAIKPKGWTILMFLIGMLTMWVGVPLSVKDIRRGRKAGKIGVLLCLLPWPLSLFLLHFSAFLRGFAFAP